MAVRMLALALLVSLTACGAAKRAVNRAEDDVKATPDKIDDRGKDVKETTKDAEEGGVEAETEVDPEG